MSTQSANITLPDGRVIECERTTNGWGHLDNVEGYTTVTIYLDTHLTRIGRSNNFTYVP